MGEVPDVAPAIALPVEEIVAALVAPGSESDSEWELEASPESDSESELEASPELGVAHAGPRAARPRACGAPERLADDHRFNALEAELAEGGVELGDLLAELDAADNSGVDEALETPSDEDSDGDDSVIAKEVEDLEEGESDPSAVSADNIIAGGRRRTIVNLHDLNLEDGASVEDDDDADDASPGSSPGAGSDGSDDASPGSSPGAGSEGEESDGEEFVPSTDDEESDGEEFVPSTDDEEDEDDDDEKDS